MLAQYGRQGVLDDWRDLSSLTAVRQGRVLIFDQGHDIVPGPRVVRLVEDLARRLHPEVDWDQWQKGEAEQDQPETE